MMPWHTTMIQKKKKRKHNSIEAEHMMIICARLDRKYYSIQWEL